MAKKTDIHTLLTAGEKRLLQKLNSPAKIQNFLDSLPFNLEKNGETYMSPRRALKARTMHCFEGALIAAAALLYHGQKPLLLDLDTTHNDQDHVVALFKEGAYWGATSKTNHAVLRYRDAVYGSVRELAMTYFHEYFLTDGRKSMRGFSAPFDLSKYPLESWLTAENDLIWLADALTDSKHFPVAPKQNIKALRKATYFEVDTHSDAEWKQRARRKK